jgi:hypothetical protein
MQRISFFKRYLNHNTSFKSITSRGFSNTVGTSVTHTTKPTTSTTSSTSSVTSASASARDALALASVATSATSLIQATASISSGIDENVIRNCSTWDILADTVKTLQATRKPWGVKLIVSVLERAAALSTISSSSSYSSALFDRILKPIITKELDRGDVFLRSINSSSNFNRSFSPPGSLVALLPEDLVRIIEALDTLAKNGLIIDANDEMLLFYNSISGAFNRGVSKVPGSLRNIRSKALVQLLQCGDRFEIMSRRGFKYRGEESILDSRLILSEMRLSELLNGTNNNNDACVITFGSSEAHSNNFFWTSSANQRLAFEFIAAELTSRLSSTSSSGLYSRTSWKASQLGSICSSAISTVIGALRIEAKLKNQSIPNDDNQFSEIKKVKESALALLYASLNRASSDGGLLRAARSMQTFWAGKATLSSADTQDGAHGGGSSSSGSDTENKSRLSSSGSIKISSEDPNVVSQASSPAIHNPDHASASFADVWIRQILNAVSVVAILRLERFQDIAAATFVAVASCCSVQNSGALSTGFYTLRHVEAARTNSRDTATIDWIAVKSIEPSIASRRSSRSANSSVDIDGISDDVSVRIHPKYITMARTFQTSHEILGSFLFAYRTLQSLNSTSTKDILYATTTCANDLLRVIDNAARIMSPSCPPSYYITDASSSTLNGGNWSIQRSTAALMAILEASLLMSSSLTSDGLSSLRDSKLSQTAEPPSVLDSSGRKTACRMIALSALVPAPPAGSVHNKTVEDFVHTTSATSSLEQTTAFLSTALAARIGARFPVPRAMDPHDFSRDALLSLKAAEQGEAKMEELLAATSSGSTSSFRPFVSVAATRIHRRLESLYNVVEDINDATSEAEPTLTSTTRPIDVEEEEPDLARRARVLRSKISLKHTRGKHRTFSTLMQKGGKGNGFGGPMLLPLSALTKGNVRRTTSPQLIAPTTISSLFSAVSCLLVQAYSDISTGNIISARTCLMQSDLILAKWKKRVAPQSQMVREGLKSSAFETPIDTKDGHQAPIYPHLTLLLQGRDIMSHETTSDALIAILSSKVNLYSDDIQGGQMPLPSGVHGRFNEFGAALLTRVCFHVPPFTIQQGLTFESERGLSQASGLLATLLESGSTSENSLSALESLAYSSTVFTDLFQQQGKRGEGVEWNAQSGIYLPVTLVKGLRGILDGIEKVLLQIESKRGSLEIRKEQRIVDALHRTRDVVKVVLS